MKYNSKWCQPLIQLQFLELGRHRRPVSKAEIKKARSVTQGHLSHALLFLIIIQYLQVLLYRPSPGIIRIAIAGLQNPNCITFWWIAPEFENDSKKEDFIADWTALCSRFLQSNPDLQSFPGTININFDTTYFCERNRL